MAKCEFCGKDMAFGIKVSLHPLPAQRKGHPRGVSRASQPKPRREGRYSHPARLCYTRRSRRKTMSMD